jgi:hypothetical protein
MYWKSRAGGEGQGQPAGGELQGDIYCSTTIADSPVSSEKQTPKWIKRQGFIEGNARETWAGWKAGSSSR